MHQKIIFQEKMEKYLQYQLKAIILLNFQKEGD